MTQLVPFLAALFLQVARELDLRAQFSAGLRPDVVTRLPVGYVIACLPVGDVLGIGGSLYNTGKRMNGKWDTLDTYVIPPQLTEPENCP